MISFFIGPAIMERLLLINVSNIEFTIAILVVPILLFWKFDDDHLHEHLKYTSSKFLFRSQDKAKVFISRQQQLNMFQA